jgi:DNA-binding beta-propeller fold protein YncE
MLARLASALAPLAPALALLAWARPSPAFENHVFAVTTDYFTSGSSAAIEIEPPWPATTGLEPVSADPVVRYAGGRIYVVNRFGADNIQVIDPETFDTIAECSVGAGSNPNDIVVIDEHRAYVTRYETAELYEFDPITCTVLDVIDLSVFADADGIPEMSVMALDGTHLFVQIQRWDRDISPWEPVPPSYLAVIDITTNAIVDVDPVAPGVQAIALTGLNPFGQMRIDETERRLYVPEPGVYQTADGGIDAVDLDTFDALGFITTEAQLGGDLGPFDFASFTEGFAVAGAFDFSTYRLVRFSRATGNVLGTLYTTTGLIPDIECDPPSSQAFLADRRVTAPGVHVFDLATGNRLTGAPINVGLPPADLVVVRQEPVDVAGAPHAVDRAAWAAPNPFGAETAFHLQGDAGPTRVTIFDAAGRAVRTLAATAREVGETRVRWDGRDDRGLRLPGGVYSYRVEGGGFTATGRVILIR